MIELGLCFLEVRPYFFHSGYYWKKILQVCKRVPMSAEHAERLRLLILNYAQWKELRKESAARGAAVSRQIWPLVCRFFDMFPAHIADHHYDGAATVGDLYRVVCNALKIEPLANPAPEMGEVRAAYRRGGNVHAWHTKVWSPEDVWATLEWLIRDVYGLEPTFQISPDVLLRSLKDK
jgi:hypothetical protein